MPSLARFFRLLAADGGPHVFNPWTESDVPNDGALNGPTARRQRLRAHLRVAARRILIGEACGYQGCHVTGIPFTHERNVMARRVPRIASDGERLSTRHIPWSEPSATTVWNTLYALGIEQDTVLWNAFPWHPHQPHRPQSNRTPSPAERARGLPVLEALLRALPEAAVFAVGRHAQQALQEVGVTATTLRHPSMGGAREFARGLHQALKARSVHAPRQ